MKIMRLNLTVSVLFPLAVTSAYAGCVGKTESPGFALDASSGDGATIAAEGGASDAGAGADVTVIDARTEDVSVLDGSTADADDASGDAGIPDGAADAGGDDGGPMAACADGTREGLSSTQYRGIAACAGTWSGNVATAALCAPGSHVCTGVEPALTALAYADALAVTGCFAINAAQDNNICYPDCAAAVAHGIDTAANVDMGAIGDACPYHYAGYASCITGGRIDFSENSGSGCDYAAGLSGVVCCVDDVADAGDAGDSGDGGDGG